MPSAPPPVSKRYFTRPIDATSIQVREFHTSGYGSITVYEYTQVNAPATKPRILEENEVGVFEPDEAHRLALRYVSEGFTEVK